MKRTMKAIAKIIEEHGWAISDCGIGPKNEKGWELHQYSPAGEDFSFTVQHDEDPEKAIKEIRNYAFSVFDVEEHIKMWTNARDTVSGVLEVMTVIKDAKAIKKMLKTLADALEGIPAEDMCQSNPLGAVIQAGDLKEFLKTVPDDAKVYVACQGYCNYDFKNSCECEDNETFAIMRDGNLFITDTCAVDDEAGGTL